MPVPFFDVHLSTPIPCSTWLLMNFSGKLNLQKRYTNVKYPSEFPLRRPCATFVWNLNRLRNRKHFILCFQQFVPPFQLFLFCTQSGVEFFLKHSILFEENFKTFFLRTENFFNNYHQHVKKLILRNINIKDLWYYKKVLTKIKFDFNINNEPKSKFITEK